MSDIYLSLTETPSVVTLSQPVIASSVAATVTVGNTVTVALDANSLSALENVTVTVGAAVSVSNFPSIQTIAGTVAANLADQLYDSGTPVFVAAYVDSPGGSVIPVSQDANAGMPISGTVTANVFGKDNTGTPLQLKTDAAGVLFVSASGSVQCVDEEGLIFGSDRNFPVSGTVTVGNSVTIGSLPAISGTVTANNPSGALTTRFGSVTTASVAQLTSCVTNTSRKYLLAQNISAGTVTIGIGFSPTTTQGIQLTAGAGLTFDSFCPTGAVFWLGAVTGAAFTILEG